MDKTDVVLSQMLLVNSRTPYRELGLKLGLSVNAVHKRIQAMQQAGIIRAFTARVGLYPLKATTVFLFGRSAAPVTEEMARRLGTQGSIYWVTLAGGNFIYIGANLRSISELGPLVEFVKKEGQLPDPTIGIADPIAMHSPPQATPLSKLDYRIIRSMASNSRKPLTEVADDVGISAKTVQRRLEKMTREYTIELSMDWYPDVSNDIMTIFHINLKPSSDRASVGPGIMARYSPNAIFNLTFSNLPNLLTTIVWTNSMKELQEIRLRLQAEDFVESLMPNVLFIGYTFDTWRDRLVFEKTPP
jgi:DNA-binding Lrp family transcriptional regulator